MYTLKRKYRKHTVSKECTTQRATGGLKLNAVFLGFGHYIILVSGKSINSRNRTLLRIVRFEFDTLNTDLLIVIRRLIDCIELRLVCFKHRVTEYELLALFARRNDAYADGSGGRYGIVR